MLAVNQKVAKALNKSCEAWHLLLDKFSFESDKKSEAKTEALIKVHDCYQRLVPTHLKLAVDRTLAWLSALERQHGERLRTVELVAESRLLLHLGRPSVLENVGIYFERTTGLPIIPGTALKGVVSTWACWLEHLNPQDGSFCKFTSDSKQRRNFTSEEAKLAQLILGDDCLKGSEHAGEVIFVGGFPLNPPKLGLDIVNQHHDANGQPLTRLTPHTFLCIEPGAWWRFVFFVRPGVANAKELLDTTERWIIEALTQLGIGAKTAAGYGRFRLPTDADRKAAHGSAATTQVTPKTQHIPEPKKARQEAAAQALLRSDYPNEATFRNRVLAKLNRGQLDQLKAEIDTLKKPENAQWLQKLKTTLASKDYKDIRKLLRDKDWFPKDWLG